MHANSPRSSWLSSRKRPALRVRAKPILEVKVRVMASVKIPLGVDGVEYRLIPGHEDYAVGDDGSIWSFKPLYRQRTPAWRRIRPAVKENGYLYFTPVVASPEVKGGPRRKQICYVHRAVLMAFLGPCPDGMEAC